MKLLEFVFNLRGYRCQSCSMFVYVLHFEDMIIRSDRSDSGDSSEVTLCRADRSRHLGYNFP